MIDLKQVAEFMIFRDIEAEDLKVILAGSKELDYAAGTIVLEEDEHGPDSDLFIILDGRVEVLVELAQPPRGSFDAHKLIAVLNPGEVFGEIGLLRGRRRSAQIKAYTQLKVLKVNRETLFRLLETKPQLGYRFMRNLATILSDRLVDLNFLWRNET